MTTRPVPDGAKPPAIFSYPLEVAAVPPGGLDIAIEADPATLRALAEADELPNIARLAADFHVVPLDNERFNVSGEVRASVTQICGVSLEPFETEVVEPVDVDFAPLDAIAGSESSSDLPGGGASVGETRDPPDPIVGGRIDLGVLASEFMALGLDPYPRKPGISFDASGSQDAAADDAAANPFSILRQLKERP